MPTSVGERRIALWRNCLFLFTKIRKDEGPFHRAGYTDYFLEARDTKKRTPDIFGFSPEWFVVADLSMSKQKSQVSNYKDSILPHAVEQAIAPADPPRHSAGDPFLLSDVNENHPEDDANWILFATPPRVSLATVHDDRLRNELEKWEGFSVPPPSFNLSAVPESSRDEVKEALAGVLKWAATQDKAIEVEIFVEKLLGDLYNSFSPRSRARLRSSVEDAIKEFVEAAPDMIEFDKRKRLVTVKRDYLGKARRPDYAQAVLQWLGSAPTSLDRWLDQDFEEEDDEDEADSTEQDS